MGLFPLLQVNLVGEYTVLLIDFVYDVLSLNVHNQISQPSDTLDFTGGTRAVRSYAVD